MEKQQPNSSFDEFHGSVQSKQEIDLRWMNVNVFVHKGKPGSTSEKKKSKTKPINDPLLESSSREVGSVDQDGQFKQILTNQTGYAAHGETLALMGPSGAGKTTLLSVLTARFEPNKLRRLTGEVVANAQPYNNLDFSQFGVFVMQNDLLFPSLTVKETLLFAARMKLKGSDYMKRAKVDKLIRDLGLQPCQNTYIGSQLVKGISGGERKRACIGVELVADPQVLFLDEPTSGLDSFTAYNLMILIRNLAKKEKKCIVLSIHTPSYDIFTLIDRLLLLQDGKMVYQGPTQDLIPYIQRLGQQVPEFQNICDFFMYEITLEKQKTVLNSANFELHCRDKLNRDSYKYTPSAAGFPKSQDHNSMFFQFIVLIGRSYKNYMRNPQLLGSRIFITIFLTLYYSFLYWNIGGNTPPNPATAGEVNIVDNYVISVQGVLFNVGASSFFQTIQPVVSVFPRERAIFLKEENSRTYGVVPYFLAKVLVEIQFIFTQPLISGTAFYFVLQFPYNLYDYLQFILLCIGMAWCGNGIGLLSGSIFPDINKSAALAPLVFQPMQIFSGYFENFSTMSSYLTFVQYISPFKYTFEGFVTIFLSGKTYTILNTDGSLMTVVDPMKQLNISLTYWQCIGWLFLLGLAYHVISLCCLKLLIRRLKA